MVATTLKGFRRPIETAEVFSAVENASPLRWWSSDCRAAGVRSSDISICFSLCHVTRIDPELQVVGGLCQRTPGAWTKTEGTSPCVCGRTGVVESALHEIFGKLTSSDRFVGVVHRFEAERGEHLEILWGLTQIRESFRCFSRWAVFRQTLRINCAIGLQCQILNGGEALPRRRGLEPSMRVVFRTEPIHIRTHTYTHMPVYPHVYIYHHRQISVHPLTHLVYTCAHPSVYRNVLAPAHPYTHTTIHPYIAYINNHIVYVRVYGFCIFHAVLGV